MDAFDADVLIYAADEVHPQGDRIRGLLTTSAPGSCIGSVLLLPEVLIKPERQGPKRELDELKRLTARLILYDVSVQTVDLAVTFGARYRLKTVDAVHLATAVLAGADRFITNNRRDFDPTAVTEIDITFPDDLPTP